jgi:putative effector of murein hydrolase
MTLLAQSMTESNARAAWEQIIAMPVFAISLTLGTYQLGRCLQRLCRGNPIVNPVLISILLIGGFLHLTGASSLLVPVLVHFWPK